MLHAVDGWAQATRRGMLAAASMWRAFCEELLRTVVGHADPGAQAHAALRNIAQQYPSGEPSDAALEVWYDHRAVEVAVSVWDARDRLVHGHALAPNEAARDVASHPEWVARVRHLHEARARAVRSMRYWVHLREDLALHHLPADTPIVGCRVHIHNLAECQRRAEERRQAAAAEESAERLAAARLSAAVEQQLAWRAATDAVAEAAARRQAQLDKRRAKKKAQRQRKKGDKPE
jgi:hypothetical protein